MKNARALACLSVGVLLTAMSLGCGSGNYTPPLTTVSKSNNPLVAQYNIVSSHAGITAWVEFGLDTNYGRQTSVVTDPSPAGSTARDTLTVLVAGMLPQKTYHMRAHVNWPGGGSFVDDDQTFTTGAPLPLPSTSAYPVQFSVSLPSSSGNNAQVMPPSPGVELLSMGPEAAAADLQGNLIWSCPGQAFPVKLLPNGHMWINIGTDIQEIDLACNVIRDVSLDQVNASLTAQGSSIQPLTAFHHDMLLLPNGHWLALTHTTQNYDNLVGYEGTSTAVLGDIILDIDPTNGNVAWSWSSFDHLDPNRHLQGLPDWTHSNDLVLTPDGNIIVSMRHQSWLIKIDYENGQGSGNVLWKLGQDGDFTILGGDPTQWFYGQHDAQIVSNNGSQTTLSIFDNGNLRIDSTGTACGSTSTAPACYSRATLFTIDESTFVADLLWSDLTGYYSWWGGSIQVLGNNDVEFDMSDPNNGLTSQINEVTQAGSPQTVWTMNISGTNAYRGLRIPSLYPGVSWQQ